MNSPESLQLLCNALSRLILKALPPLALIREFPEWEELQHAWPEYWVAELADAPDGDRITGIRWDRAEHAFVPIEDMMTRYDQTPQAETKSLDGAQEMFLTTLNFVARHGIQVLRAESGFTAKGSWLGVTAECAESTPSGAIRALAELLKLPPLA
jgi:hypothetical protein